MYPTKFRAEINFAIPVDSKGKLSVFPRAIHGENPFIWGKHNIFNTSLSSIKVMRTHEMRGDKESQDEY